MPFSGWFTIFIFVSFFCAGLYLGWQKDQILPMYWVVMCMLTAAGYMVGLGAKIFKILIWCK